MTTGNVLDSTAPVTRRGKERETPKAKKPTQLRKVHMILTIQTTISACTGVYM